MDAAAYHERKRRVRKGTKSCWECKRRKMKCTLDPLSPSAVCGPCRRRGSNCVSQEFPEDVPPGLSDAESAGMEGIPTPASTRSSTRSSTVDIQHTASEIYNWPSAPRHRHGALSQELHASLPSREDMERICRAHRHPSVPVLAHEILTMSYATLERKGFKTPESLLEAPAATSHPVLLAQHMLQVAIFLQHVHPRNEDLNSIGASPRAIQEQLADLAIRRVTTNDELTGNIEGLVCIMMESMYQVNVGNLRRGWLAGRRAIGIAQLMGLDGSERRANYKTIDPRTCHDAQFMWYRINFLDCHLSLMLGLSHGRLDRSLATAEIMANDTPTGRLERMQYIIASRILERNASSRLSSCLDPDQLALTEALDAELQRAAQSLDSKWWRAPNLDNVTAPSSEALFWDTRRLFAQVLHYNLVNQLHLPYMLRPASASQQRRYHYARMTCANASREIISRFVILRGFNQIAYSWSCRIVDFLALMAAMTLLLAHLDSHGDPESRDVLAQQYVTDRAAVEQVHEHMEEVNRLNSDVLSAQSANMLRRLLAINADPTESRSGSGRRVTVHELMTETTPCSTGADGGDDGDDDAVASAHIPYFGVFKVADDGRRQTATTANYGSSLERQDKGDQGPGGLAGFATTEVTSPVETASGEIASSADRLAYTKSPVWHFYNDILAEQPEGYYDTTAAGEEWAFQGVDLTFLDTLTGGYSASEGNSFFQQDYNGFM